MLPMPIRMPHGGRSPGCGGPGAAASGRGRVRVRPRTSRRSRSPTSSARDRACRRCARGPARRSAAPSSRCAPTSLNRSASSARIISWTRFGTRPIELGVSGGIVSTLRSSRRCRSGPKPIQLGAADDLKVLQLIGVPNQQPQRDVGRGEAARLDLHHHAAVAGVVRLDRRDFERRRRRRLLRRLRCRAASAAPPAIDATSAAVLKDFTYFTNGLVMVCVL